MDNAWHIRFTKILVLIIAAATLFALFRVFVFSDWSGITFFIAGITGIIASVFLLLKDTGGSFRRQKRLLAIAFVWCLPVLCISISHTHPTILDRVSLVAIWIFLMILALTYTFKKMVLEGLPAVPVR